MFAEVCQTILCRTPDWGKAAEILSNDPDNATFTILMLLAAKASNIVLVVAADGAKRIVF